MSVVNRLEKLPLLRFRSVQGYLFSKHTSLGPYRVTMPMVLLKRSYGCGRFLMGEIPRIL